jgi:hypothetical protein
MRISTTAILFLVSSSLPSAVNGFGIQSSGRLAPRAGSQTYASSLGFFGETKQESIAPNNTKHDYTMLVESLGKAALSALLVLSLSPLSVSAAVGDGASSAANAKLTTGGASTLQSGRTISITRGVNLDNSDFHGQNLRGVAFQQSIVRDSNFKDCNLYGASFF